MRGGGGQRYIASQPGGGEHLVVLEQELQQESKSWHQKQEQLRSYQQGQLEHLFCHQFFYLRILPFYL